MSRVFKRPMFRKGGNVGEGIMTGIRDNYEVGGSAEEQLAKIAEKYPEQGFDPLTQFLIQGGLNLVSQPSTGGVLSDIATAAKDPTEQLFKGMAEKGKLARELAIAGKQLDIEQTGRERLQKQELEARMKMLEREKELERMTSSEKIQQYGPQYAESEYDNDMTKGNRRATYEFQVRDEIATKYGESKVGGHFDIDVLNEKQVNKFMKRRIKSGGANKIYYNVNDGRRYLLTEQGLEPVTASTAKEDIDKNVVDTVEKQTKKEINPSYMRPPKPDVITPKIKDYMKSVEEEEGQFGTGS
jgi:hypothetical protein